MMDAPGKKHLRTAGILYICLALVAIFVLVMTGRLTRILFLSVSYPLFLGVMGVLYCNRLEKATLLVCLAAVQGVSVISDLIFGIVTGTFLNSSIPLILSSVYLYGAIQNLRENLREKKYAAEMREKQYADKMRELHAMLEEGAITQKEFEKAKSILFHAFAS